MHKHAIMKSSGSKVPRNPEELGISSVSMHISVVSLLSSLNSKHEVANYRRLGGTERYLFEMVEFDRHHAA